MRRGLGSVLPRRLFPPGRPPASTALFRAASTAPLRTRDTAPFRRFSTQTQQAAGDESGGEKSSGSGGQESGPKTGFWMSSFGAGIGAFGAMGLATSLEKLLAEEAEEVIKELFEDYAEEWLSEEISDAVEFVVDEAKDAPRDVVAKRIEVRKRNLAAAMRFLDKQQGESQGLMDMLGVDGRGFAVSRVPHNPDRYLAAGDGQFWRDMEPGFITEYEVTSGKRTDETDGPMPHDGVASMATALFSHHPDIRVVMHVPGGRPSVALSAVAKPSDHAPLLPISDPGRIYAAGGVRILESKSRMRGLAFSEHFCDTVKQVLTEENPPFCILIRNGGGYIMTGKTVHECWYRCRMFEAACDIQLKAMAADVSGLLKSGGSSWGILGKRAEKAVSADMPGWVLSSGKREWQQKLLDLKKNEDVKWVG